MNTTNIKTAIPTSFVAEPVNDCKTQQNSNTGGIDHA